MAGKKQRLEIPLALGLDTKTHPHLVRSGNLQLLNAIINRNSAVVKRPGTTALSMLDTGGGTIAAVKRLVSYHNELLLLDGQNMYSYNETLDKWKNVGGCPALRVSEDIEIGDNIFGDRVPPPTERLIINSMAYANGFYVYVYSPYDASLRTPKYSIVDATSGNVIVRDGTLANAETANHNGQPPRAVAMGDIVLIIYPGNTSNNALRAAYLDLTDPTAAPLTYQIATDLNAGGASERTFDVIPWSSREVLIAYHYDLVNNYLKLARLDLSGNLTVAAVANFGRRAGGNRRPVSLCKDTGSSPNFTVYVFSVSAGAWLQVTAFYYNDGLDTFVRVGGQVDVENLGGPPDISAIVCQEADGLTDEATVFYEWAQATVERADQAYIKTARVNGTPAVTSAAAVFARSVGIGARPFKQSNGNLYLPAVYCRPQFRGVAVGGLQTGIEPRQNVGLVLDAGGLPVAYYLAGTLGYDQEPGIGGIIRQYVTNFTGITWTDVVQPATNQFVFPKARMGPAVYDDANYLPSTVYAGQLAKITVDFNRPTWSTKFNDNLLIVGGMLWSYDGYRVMEYAPLLYPQGLTGVSANLGGAVTPGGVYLVCCVYVFVDADGVRHRSAPSSPVTVTVGGGDDAIRTQVPTLRMTRLDGTEDALVSIELYRTDDGRSTFYCETAVENDKTVDAIQVDLVDADADLLDGRTLYTLGDVLDEVLPPQIGSVTSAPNRVMFAPESGRAFYSKLRTQEAGAAFNEALVLLPPKTGGKLTNIAHLGGNIIIWAEQAIYRYYGVGPNNLGQGSFSEPETISEQIGCLPDTPLLRVNEGFIFSSQKGLWLLDVGLNLSYIGAGIEKETADFAGGDSSVVAAACSEEEDLALFNLNTAVVTLDTATKRWSQWTFPISGYWNYNPQVDVVRWDGAWIIGSNTVVHKEDTGFDDQTAAAGWLPVLFAVRTPWLRLGDLDGFQRLKEIHFMGRWKSAHTLRINIYYNYDDAVSRQAVDFDLSTGYSVDQPILLRIKPSIQKCRAVSIQIVDQNVAGTGESLELVGLTLVAQGKRKLKGFGDSK